MRLWLRIILTRMWPQSSSNSISLFSINLHRAKQIHIWLNKFSCYTTWRNNVLLSLFKLQIGARSYGAVKSFWLFRPWNSRNTSRQQQLRKELNTFLAKRVFGGLFCFSSALLSTRQWYKRWTCKRTLSRSSHDQMGKLKLEIREAITDWCWLAFFFGVLTPGKFFDILKRYLFM